MDILNYYTTGITAHGYKSFLENNLKGIKEIIFMKGDSDKGLFVEGIISLYEKGDYSLEYIHSPYKKGAYEGIINKTLNKAVIFHTNANSPIAKMDNVKVIDTDQVLTDSYIDYKKYISKLNEKKEDCIEIAYTFMHNALKIHDEWEKIYIDNMDFKKADDLSDSLIEKLIGAKSLDKRATVNDRFLGAATPEGPSDYIDNLTANIKKRYFIKGRPGTGKSTILKKIAKKAERNGFDVEIYHCGFDSNSLDMLIMRELDICIFDSTAPHEYFPDRANDEIVDVYAEAVNSHTDENYSQQLNEIAMRYKSNIKIATSYLQTMKIIDDEIQKIYSYCTDNAKMKMLSNELFTLMR